MKIMNEDMKNKIDVELDPIVSKMLVKSVNVIAEKLGEVTTEYFNSKEGDIVWESGFADSVVVRAALRLMMSAFAHMDEDMRPHAFGTATMELSFMLAELKANPDLANENCAICDDEGTCDESEVAVCDTQH
jgi:hypothetical protein